jgi:hypothetical protein
MQHVVRLQPWQYQASSQYTAVPCPYTCTKAELVCCLWGTRNDELVVNSNSQVLADRCISLRGVLENTYMRLDRHPLQIGWHCTAWRPCFPFAKLQSLAAAPAAPFQYHLASLHTQGCQLWLRCVRHCGMGYSQCFVSHGHHGHRSQLQMLIALLMHPAHARSG